MAFPFQPLEMHTFRICSASPLFDLLNNRVLFNSEQEHPSADLITVIESASAESPKKNSSKVLGPYFIAAIGALFELQMPHGPERPRPIPLYHFKGSLQFS